MGEKLGVTGFTIHDEKLWGNYRATVLNNSDPLQLGRVKAEVIPYFIGIDETLIPWAVPKNGMSGGAGAGFGVSDIPAVGSEVWVFFEFGDVYQPVYDGGASNGVMGLPSFITTNYPNTRGFQTPSGIKFYINDTTKTVTLTHPSGTSFVMDTTGDLSIASAGNVTITGKIINITGSTSVNINPV